MDHQIIVSTLALCLAFILVYLSIFERHDRLPPGPKPLPFLGNILQLPAKYKERTFVKWGNIYGDIVYAHFLRTPIIIINAHCVAQDILDKKSSIYSDRPNVAVLSDMTGMNISLPALPYGEQARKQRKWFQHAVASKSTLKQYQPIQRRETLTLLSGICENAGSLRLHINRFAAGILMEISYGYTIRSLDDIYVHLANQAMAGTLECGYPGLMLVDFVPLSLLKLLPTRIPGYLGWFIRTASMIKGASVLLHDTPYNMVKSAIASGNARPSLVSSLLSDNDSDSDELDAQHEIDIKATAASIYSDHGQQMLSVLSSFLLALLLHPRVLQKAREELDQVVGTERLPDFDDRKHLAYMECVLQEVYRWACPAPVTMLHKLAVDDEYQGYHIPAGASVVANAWAMTRDVRTYVDPEVFRPERFQDLPVGAKDTMDPRCYMFGFGRRVCPGKLLADSSLWLAMASIISTFDVVPSRDARGRQIIPEATWESGIIRQPVKFEVDIRPRSQKSLELIKQLAAHPMF
ncbi:hypothetical protein IEO21_03756 [Rhodonia placenta]|uniref:Cytochrome P450 n=1 Tax=Rhodonia placenta TaxID=104341 RepID=A0A8H7U3X4_9APHY|nr:hypothetical protein IEO21_03756 [Postia placenta]